MRGYDDPDRSTAAQEKVSVSVLGGDLWVIFIRIVIEGTRGLKLDMYNRTIGQIRTISTCFFIGFHNEFCLFTPAI